MNKFGIEKTLHEVIRDIPDAYKANRNYEHGFITFEECMKTITDAYNAEQIRISKEFWEEIDQA